jgi:molybdate transport system substrate-binding protein
VRILCTNALKSYAEGLIHLLDQSDQETIQIQFAPTQHITSKILDGESVDVIFLSKQALSSLCSLPQDSNQHSNLQSIQPTPKWSQCTDIASTCVGVAMKPGLAKPALHSREQFVNFLLNASSIGITTEGISGVYVQQLIQRLGLEQATEQRIKRIRGGLVAEMILDGRVDFVIQNISELLAVKGVELVGPLPDELQLTTVFSAAIHSQSVDQAVVKRFWTLALSQPSRDLLLACKMTPILSGSSIQATKTI